MGFLLFYFILFYDKDMQIVELTRGIVSRFTNLKFWFHSIKVDTSIYQGRNTIIILVDARMVCYKVSLNLTFI